jgi:hypothetical protein
VALPWLSQKLVPSTGVVGFFGNTINFNWAKLHGDRLKWLIRQICNYSPQRAGTPKRQGFPFATLRSTSISQKTPRRREGGREGGRREGGRRSIITFVSTFLNGAATGL